MVPFLSFFFQAEDGIRAATMTGVQTCALPICGTPRILSKEIQPCLADAGIKPRSGEIARDETRLAEQVGRKAKTCRGAARCAVINVGAARHAVGKGQFT